jgi:surface protein
MNRMFRQCTALTFIDTTGWDTSNVTNFDLFTQGTNCRVTFGDFVLKNNVVLFRMLDVIFGARTSLQDQEDYSRTLIGWANNIFSRGGVVTGRSLGASGRRYNNINYVLGQQFNNAVDARDYLVNTLGWTISGDATVYKIIKI